MMLCPKCGKRTGDDQAFCNSCGSRLEKESINTRQLFENIEINAGMLSDDFSPPADSEPPQPRQQQPRRIENRTEKKRRMPIALLLILSLVTSLVISSVYVVLNNNQTAAINRFAAALTNQDADAIRESAVFNGISPTDDELISMAATFDEEDIKHLKTQLSAGESRTFSSFSIVERSLTWPFKKHVVSVTEAKISITGLTEGVPVTVNKEPTTPVYNEGVALISGLIPGQYSVEFGESGYQAAIVVSFKVEGEPLQAIATGPIVLPEDTQEPEPTPEPEPVPEPEPEPEPTEPQNANDALFSELADTAYTHYKSYLLSQTAEDLSLLEKATIQAIGDAQVRLDSYNRGNTFELVSMTVDTGTISIYDSGTNTQADVLAKVVFTSASKDEPDVVTTVEDHIVFTMVLQPDLTWLVDVRNPTDRTVGETVKQYIENE